MPGTGSLGKGLVASDRLQAMPMVSSANLITPFLSFQGRAWDGLVPLVPGYAGPLKG